MFRHYRVIPRQPAINTLPSYTSISNAAVGNTVYNFKIISHLLYTVEISMFKIAKILKSIKIKNIYNKNGLK
jgi:hypothetical protein